jgi:nicotinic acid mononucleotide adenylyltransferase
LLDIRTAEVRARIRAGGDWEAAVQPDTAALIKREGLFGYPAEA